MRSPGLCDDDDDDEHLAMLKQALLRRSAPGTPAQSHAASPASIEHVARLLRHPLAAPTQCTGTRSTSRRGYVALLRPMPIAGVQD
ncbi:hypothetical protein EW145_g4436 [Phellinidium pouzarii]|uniref:Uncharacterized protein n=1 Tax=Phellinidium pouzarii TaxID=167371 RepID=A0A4S4L3Z6_9AGAM|nr:hypothetical protein EW145_g4436 [Phellinidium pouzarii]